jgi:hypothetical protein
MCYYCGQHLRIENAVLVCVNVLCKLFGVAQNKKTVEVIIKSEET